MEKLIGLLVTALLLSGCTNSEYTQSLASYAISASQAGLTGLFQMEMPGDGGTAGLTGKVKITESALGAIQIVSTEEDAQNMDAVLIEVSGKLYLETRGNDANFSLTRIAQIDPSDRSKGFEIREMNFTDKFEASPEVKSVTSGSGFFSSTFYIADNSHLSAEELLANTVEKQDEKVLLIPAQP